MGYTVVSFHAHPDDEALFTAGTLARAVAEGHRIVLVVATAGEAGLAASDVIAAGDLAARRRAELRRSAAVLGCDEVHELGYDDSGLDGRAGRDGHAFSRVGVEEPARRLAAVLADTGADVLTIYDPAGGYGHPDHAQVHRVGVRAAEIAGTPVVLEATVDRRPLLRVLRILRVLRVVPSEWGPDRFATAYAQPERITHRVDVRPFTDAKRAAMAAHATQATSDDGVRTLSFLLKLPQPVFRRVFAHEWFVERGRVPAGVLLDDVFASLRARTGTLSDGRTEAAESGHETERRAAETARSPFGGMISREVRSSHRWSNWHSNRS